MGRQVAAKKITAAALLFVLCLSTPASADAAEQASYLVPMGCAIGICLDTDGLLVSGFKAVETQSGEETPAVDSGMRVGDVITHINSYRVMSAEDLKSVLDDCGENKVSVRVCRKGETLQLTLCPALNGDGGLELGVLVRDSVSGIGTVTYYDPQTGSFGALGHSVNDLETGVALPIRGGRVMPASIRTVKIGAEGSPGELLGGFDPTKIIGQIAQNTTQGIFGKMTTIDNSKLGKPLKTACRSDIRTGEAEILATIQGENVQRFKIEISRVYPQNSDGGGRDMLVTVTDPRLIELTGGIVQGMSGCPIIQNGLLVGAVTHVLVGDPCKGYAITIENMLDAAFATNANAA